MSKEIEELATAEIEQDVNHNDPARYEKQVLRAKLPTDPTVLYSSLQLSSDKNIRISKLADTVLNDPVITLEVLSKANTTFSSIDKAGITAVQTAIIRIGSENLADLFLGLKEREQIKDQEVAIEFEALRKLSARAGQVAEILANHLQRDITETAQTAGNLAYIGQMLCCQVLGRSFLEFTSLKRRSALAYKLQSNFHIDLQKVHLQYLKDKGLPGFMFFAFDRDLKCKTSAQSSLRFITDSAIEIVEAIDEGKWQKYRSPHTFPGKSNLRLLKISDSAFEAIKEEIEDLLSPEHDIPKTVDTINTEVTQESAQIAGSATKAENPEDNFHQTLVISRDSLPQSQPQPEFDELIKKTKERNPTGEYTRTELSVDSQAIFGLIQYLCEEADSVSTLLKDLMSILTEQGPFTRAAIIEFGTGEKDAQIYSAIGDDFEALGEREKLVIQDPLSPIALLATRVQSFNSPENPDPSSPFGITSYAISPISLNSVAPLILYADCGISKPVPLEARKVFRMVSQLLNEVLPQVAEKSSKKRNQATV